MGFLFLQALLSRNSALSDPGLDSPRTSPVVMARLAQHHRRQASDTPVPGASDQVRGPEPLVVLPPASRTSLPRVWPGILQLNPLEGRLCLENESEPLLVRTQGGQDREEQVASV